MSSSNNAGSVFSFEHQNCPIDIKCNDLDEDQIIGDPNDIMTNPIPRSRAVDLKKVYAYQQMNKARLKITNISFSGLPNSIWFNLKRISEKKPIERCWITIIHYMTKTIKISFNQKLKTSPLGKILSLSSLHWWLFNLTNPEIGEGPKRLNHFPT